MKKVVRFVTSVCVLSIGAEVETQKVSQEAVVPARKIEVGKKYKHYSGKEYKVIAIAHDSEDPSLMRVVYQGLYDCPSFGSNPIWDRPYPMFAESVTINGKLQQRFAEIPE